MDRRVETAFPCLTSNCSNGINALHGPVMEGYRQGAAIDPDQRNTLHASLGNKRSALRHRK